MTERTATPSSRPDQDADSPGQNASPVEKISTPYLTLLDLEDAHYALLERYDGQVSTALVDASQMADANHRDVERSQLTRLFGDVQDFRRRGAATGAYLHDFEERGSAQAKLDYWTNLCVSAGLNPQRYVLEPHDPLLMPELKGVPCPYRGLDPFDEAHAKQFFGRDGQTKSLVQKLQDGHRLIMVTGRSGSGKSSLVFAGLLPALARGDVDGSEHWRTVPPLVPGTTPLHNLLSALSSLCQRLKIQAQFEAELANMRADPSRLLALLSEATTEVGANDTQAPALLIIDQFEEVVTQRSEATESDFNAFVAALLKVIECAAPAHRVVLTMRLDVERQLALFYPDLNHLYAQGASFAASAMDSQQLQDAILRPAEPIGLQFEKGVVEALVGSVLGEDAGLTLLQFTLLELWEHRPNGRNLITNQTLRDVGSPREAMAKAAETLYNELSTDLRLATEKLFTELARSDGATVFRNRVSRGHLSKVVDANGLPTLLAKFERAHLLRVIGDPLHPSDSDLVEVAHEALLRNWGRVDGWLQSRRRQRDRRDFLRKQAEDWQAARSGGAGKEQDGARDFLLTGLVLQHAEAETKDDVLKPLEKEFLEVSRAAEIERETREQEAAHAREDVNRQKTALLLRRNRQTRRILGGVALAFLVSGLVFGFAWQTAQGQLAVAESKMQEASESAKASVDRANRDAELAKNAAEKTAAELVETARKEVIRANEESVAIRKKAEKERRAAEQARDKALHERDEAKGGKLISDAARVQSTDSDTAIRNVVEAFKKDATSLHAGAGVLVEALRYRRASLVVPKELLGSFSALGISHDGKRLAAAGGVGIIEVQIDTAKPDIVSPKRAWPKTSRPMNARFLVYAPNDRDVALASDQGVWLWRQGSEARQLSAVDSTRLQFNKDGSLLAAATRSNKVMLWDVASGEQLLDHAPFAGMSDAGRPPLDSVTFLDVDGQQHLGAVAAPTKAGQQQFFAAYRLQGKHPSPQPRIDALPLCESPPPVDASGHGFAGWLSPQHTCIHRLKDVLRGTASVVATAALRSKVQVDNVVLSGDGRHLVQLFEDRQEARVVDLESGRDLRLQGAAELGSSASYESLLAISKDGQRMAIKGGDGSVRVFELAREGKNLPIYDKTVWVSADEKLRLVQRYALGQPVLELLRMPDGTLVRSIPMASLPRELSYYALAANGSRLTFVGKCQAQPEDGKTRCATSIDVVGNGPPITHPLSPLPSISFFSVRLPPNLGLGLKGDLILDKQDSNWLVLRGSADGEVFKVAADDPDPGLILFGPPPPITLGSDSVFAVQRRSAEGTKIEIHDVVGAKSTARPGTLTYPATDVRLRFEDGGRFLVVQHGENLSLHDLRRPLDTAPMPLPLGFRELRVDAHAATVAVPRDGQPWQVLRIPTMSPVGTLPESFAVNAQGRYAWGAVGTNRSELRAVARPSAAILSFDGSSPRVTFSDDGTVVAIRLDKENQLRLYRLPEGKLLLDVPAKELQLRQSQWLTGRGGWLLGADDRMIPADAHRLLQMASERVKK